MTQHLDEPAPVRRSARPMLLALVAAFLLGGGTVALAAWQYGLPSEPAAWGVGSPERLLAARPTPANLRIEQPEVARMAEQQGGLEQRLAAAEQRLSRLDLQAQAATGNAARAEGLLIAFAARRAVDRGAELGYLTDQLRLRFGDAMPSAVERVVRGAGQPVTLDQLATRLDDLSTATSGSNGEFSLASLRAELGSLFVVRRATTPGIQPVQRLERAKLFLRSGRVPAAIEEVRRLSGGSDAQSWIADARRYVAVQRALDLLETAAVLEPRRLRDRNGAAVEQLSPVEG